MSSQKLICGQPSNSLAGVAVCPPAPARQAFWVVRDGNMEGSAGADHVFGLRWFLNAVEGCLLPCFQASLTSLG